MGLGAALPKVKNVLTWQQTSVVLFYSWVIRK